MPRMPHVPQMDRRAGEQFKWIAMFVTLMLNFGGLVWGAATVSSSVRQLERANVAQAALNAELTRALQQVTTDVGILKDRDSRKGER